VAGLSRIAGGGSLTKYPAFVGDGPEISDGSTCCIPRRRGNILCRLSESKMDVSYIEPICYCFSPHSAAVLSHNIQPKPVAISRDYFQHIEMILEAGQWRNEGGLGGSNSSEIQKFCQN
jgi:hypothetical protein